MPTVAKHRNRRAQHSRAVVLAEPQRLAIALPHHNHHLSTDALHQMPRQQEIRNPLFDRILVPAAPAHQLALLYARFQQHAVQVFRRLAGLLVHLRTGRCGCYCLARGSGVLDEVGGCGWCWGEVWEAELGVCISACSRVRMVWYERLFGEGRGGRTSLQIVRSSSHINRGKMFFRNGRLTSASWISSSTSRGWRGKLEACVLQVLMAQVRKLRVRSFIVAAWGRYEVWRVG